MSSAWPALAHCGQNGPHETAKTAELLTIPAAPPPPRQKRVRLGTVREVRAELAKIYREARSGKIDTTTATRLAYLLDLCSRMIERSQLEERIEALEAKAGK